MWQIYHKGYVWWTQLISSVCVLKKPLRETARMVLSYSASFVAHIISRLFPFSVFYRLGGSCVPIPNLRWVSTGSCPAHFLGQGRRMYAEIVGSPLAQNEEAGSDFYRPPNCSHEEKMELTVGEKERTPRHWRVPAPTGSEAVLTLGSPIKCFVCKPGWGWAFSHVHF